MNAIEPVLSTFGAGLGFGLLITFFTWLNSRRSRSVLKKELDTFKSHLNVQMNINAKGYEGLKQEVEKLRKENENLRITVATLSNKPGRAELKTLHMWDKAIRRLSVASPAFAPAWEMAIAEAQKEVEETDSGVKKLVRKVFSALPQDSSQTDS